MKTLLIVLCVVFVILQYRIWVGEGSLAQMWSLKSQISQQKSDNLTLVNRNKELEAEVNDLKKGFTAIEELARSDLGMIREGETFIWLIEENN